MGSPNPVAKKKHPKKHLKVLTMKQRYDRKLDIFVDEILDQGFSWKELKQHMTWRILWKARYERGWGCIRLGKVMGMARQNVWLYYQLL